MMWISHNVDNWKNITYSRNSVRIKVLVELAHYFKTDVLGYDHVVLLLILLGT
jgi:hypothetical protein